MQNKIDFFANFPGGGGGRFSYINWHFFGRHQDVNDLEKDNCISEGPQHGIDAAKVGNEALKVSQHGNGWQWALWMVNKAAPRVCRFKLNL